MDFWVSSRVPNRVLLLEPSQALVYWNQDLSFFCGEWFSERDLNLCAGVGNLEIGMSAAVAKHLWKRWNVWVSWRSAGGTSQRFPAAVI